MPSEQGAPQDDLAEEVERAQGDPDFMGLLAEHVQRDEAILEDAIDRLGKS